MNSMAELAHRDGYGNVWCNKHEISVWGVCHLCMSEQAQKNTNVDLQTVNQHDKEGVNMKHLLYMGVKIPCNAEVRLSNEYNKTGIIEYYTRKSYDTMSCKDKFFVFEDCYGTIFISVEWCPVNLSQEERLAALDQVDCPSCIQFMKKHEYYCDKHKSLLGVDVTFDEKCAYCGLPC